LLLEAFYPYTLKVFFDDILVYSSSWSLHLQHLKTVLKLLLQYRVYARLSKCSFGLQQIDYFGHTISGQGVAMDKEKVKVVLDWPVVPTNLKQLRGFLGLTRYYIRFFKGYANIAAPLTSLLKKDNFSWNDPTAAAFANPKIAIIEALVLNLPDFFSAIYS